MISTLFGSRKGNLFGWCVMCLVFVLGSFVFVRAAGTDISMCVKTNGSVYLIGPSYSRQTCAGGDTLITFNTQGPAGPQGVAGPTGPQGPQGPVGPEGGSAKLYDANNELIGYVTGTNTQNGISFVDYVDKNLNVLATAGYEGGQVFSFGKSSAVGDSTLYYTSPGCVGQAYMVASDYAKHYIIEARDGLYVIDQSKSMVNGFSYGSKLGGQDCVNTSDLDPGTTYVIDNAYPVKNVQSMINSYAVPFHIGF